MIVRPFEPKDFEQIRQWAEEYETEYREHQFPKTGFIVDGVAAYFLYSTDSSICFLENLITNKKVDQGIKNDAIELVCEAVLNKAKELGFKVAYATTNIYAVAKRARKFGANVEIGQLLLTKDLQDPS